MAPSKDTPRRLLVPGGVAAVVLAALVWLNTTALPVVLDVPAIGVAVTLLGLVLLARALRRGAGRLAWVLLAWHLAAGGWLLVDGRLSFEVEEVRFASGEVELAGTLYLPRGGPAPAAVLVHGSGRQTRDELRYHARKLAQRGVAGLAYDKRGAGASTGETFAAGYEAYAADARAALDLLRRHPRIRPDAVGLLGYSEGEWVAPLAAAGQDLAFVVIVGASGVSPAAQVDAEIVLRLRARGFTDDDVARAQALHARVLAYQRTGEGREEVARALRAAGEEPWFAAAEDLPRADELGTADEYRWWRAVMDTEPAVVWSRVRAPALFLKGERDDRSPPDLAERALRTAFAGNDVEVSFVQIAGADHMLLRWPIGDRIPPPLFPPGLFDALAGWIHDHTRMP